MLKKLLQKHINGRLFFIITILLLIAGLTHGYNMFRYPYYENDEGVYMSQAWSLITQGELAPYTYWYDHAPAGWIFITIWTLLTGGFFTFGMSVNSGRVFMLVLHVLSALLLFYIARKTSKRSLAGIIAVLIFSLTPLGIYFQRRVLLDNIMVFWVLASMALLLKENIKLSRVILSAICFGIAILTKENAIFFIPACVYLIWLNSHKHNQKLAIVKWMLISGMVTASYFLYAALKNELFPSGFMGDTTEHVSLLETLKLQFGRGRGYSFWNPESDFYINVSEWIKRDPFMLSAGIVATIIGFFMALKNKSLRFISLSSLFFWIFLMRGKTVIDFYVVPLIPFIGLQVGILCDIFLQHLVGRKNKLYISLGLFMVVYISTGVAFTTTKHYTRDETVSQIKAVDWIRENLDENTRIVIDDYGYVDLHSARYPGDKVFEHADWFWKLQTDPDIRDAKYNNDWKKIQYIALSHEMLRQTKQDNTQNFLDKAFDNSELVTEWKEGSSSYFDMLHYISTNGDWMSMYKLKDENKILDESSWAYYKNKFIHSYGQVIDPSNGNTTSEGQSYAMLRAVWMKDKTTFDGVWQWTRDHLQYRNGDKLFSWLWRDNESGGSVVDSASATDADLDIALALIFANRLWEDPSYFKAAFEIIQDIWKNEVVNIKGRYYLTASSGANRDGSYISNPSYYSPATYHVFSQIDAAHPWADLYHDTYTTLNILADNSPSRLPPNWILISPTGELRSAEQYVLDPEVNSYGFDAFRTMWRISLDSLWFNGTDSLNYLSKVEPFFENEIKERGDVYAIYGIDGTPRVSYQSISTTVGALSVFNVTNPQMAEKIYSQKIKGKYKDDGTWGDPNNYFDQNWAWFGSALHLKYLTNLW